MARFCDETSVGVVPVILVLPIEIGVPAMLGANVSKTENAKVTRPLREFFFFFQHVVTVCGLFITGSRRGSGPMDVSKKFFRDSSGARALC